MGWQRDRARIQARVRSGSKILMTAGGSTMASAPAEVVVAEIGSAREDDIRPLFFNLSRLDCREAHCVWMPPRE